MDISTTLFLGDLSVYCTEADIYQIFEPFGLIESVQLKRKTGADGRAAYGFVTFRTRESAEAAIRTMNGQIVTGRPIRVGWAEPPKVNIKANSRSKAPVSGPSLAIREMIENGKIDSAQVHFSYVTNKVDPLREDVFRTIFQHFGDIKDVSIKKSQYHPDKGVQTGYGFIHYPLNEAGIAAAMDAVKSVHELVLDSVKYSCRLSHALEELMKYQQRSPLSSYDPMPSSATSPYSSASTYSTVPSSAAYPPQNSYHNPQPQHQQQFSTYSTYPPASSYTPTISYPPTSSYPPATSYPATASYPSANSYIGEQYPPSSYLPPAINSYSAYPTYNYPTPNRYQSPPTATSSISTYASNYYVEPPPPTFTVPSSKEAVDLISLRHSGFIKKEPETKGPDRL